ncbi:hypothetical protein SHL15_5312 [Streptomyces hygroscopicus subsp. limoneus]|nr:hypothetical protein SHL15_5312 [Streptomyces hygroscopicus subsp. limoneus]
MRFGILGPVEIRTDDGTPLDPGGPRPRALLTLLLLDAGRAVSVERLLDGLYGAEPPAGALGALQSQISRLRRRLAPHSGPAGPAGYALAVAPDTVDVHRFARLAAKRRIRSRDRMYRLLGSRPLAGFFKRLTERAATAIELRDYPA